MSESREEERVRELVAHILIGAGDEPAAALVALATRIAAERDDSERHELAELVLQAAFIHTLEFDDAETRFAERALQS